MIVDLDVATALNVPEKSWFELCASVVPCEDPDAELSIRLVDETEGRELNETYRKRTGATNILSFPCEVPEGVPCHTLGDLVICAPLVEQEAREQGKTTEAHWAHLVIHGILHLQGLDHQEEDEARRMESMEVEILARLGYPTPYENENDSL